MQEASIRTFWLKALFVIIIIIICKFIKNVLACYPVLQEASSRTSWLKAYL